MIARGSRFAGPQAQALTVSGAIDHAPRRAPSLACVSSDEELTIDSRLLRHCSRSRCVMFDNESIQVCVGEISTGSGGTQVSLRTAAHRTGENSQHRHVQKASIHSE